MVLLAALPFGVELAVGLSVLVLAGLFALVTMLSPRIEVREGQLVAGRFRIPVEVIGKVVALDAEQSRFERGPALNANARLMLRGDVRTMVRVEIDDPSDPTPYILLSTRRPEQLVSALGADRT